MEKAVRQSHKAAKQRLEGSDGVIGTLSSFLDVPDDLLAAVDAAVGEWAEAMVIDGTHLQNVVEDLKSGGLGGLPLVVRSGAGFDPPSLDRRWQAEALVERLGPGADLSLAKALLGDVVLVEEWSTGWQIVTDRPDLRAVTSEGDLITSRGILPVDPQGSSAAMVEAARRTALTLDERLQRAIEKEQTVRAALDEGRRQAESARNELAGLEADRNRARTRLDRLAQARSAKADVIAGLELRISTLRRTIEQRDHQIEALQARISHHNLDTQRTSARHDLAEARRARDASIRTLGAATERGRMLRSRMQQLEAQLETPRDTAREQTLLGEVRSVEGWARRILAIVGKKLDVLEERCSHLETKQSGRAHSVSSTREDIAEIGRRISDYRERLGRLAVEDTESRVREESVAESLRESGASVEQALASQRPPTGDESASDRAVWLEKQLARMGNVNLLATDQYRELDDRHSLMVEQLSDLEVSKAELNKVISALDNEMKVLFTSTFEEAARHYQRFFTVLFPGGAGNLRLTDPDDPLAAAVEIEAQPLGKKIGNLALLSGGERSLAALAFLFAIFKARPGPFYLLDEVDAALDDANLHRFLRLVDEFRDRAQLIVVTHQQATVRAADILYGVTMEPGGSSKVLVRKMEEASA